MKRLTTYICGYPHGAEGVKYENLTGNYCRGTFEATALIDRLAAIEDILGDEYELEQIGKVVHCKDCMHMWAEAEFPGECYCRMLGEVVPFDGFCHKGGSRPESEGAG